MANRVLLLLAVSCRHDPNFSPKILGETAGECFSWPMDCVLTSPGTFPITLEGIFGIQFLFIYFLPA